MSGCEAGLASLPLLQPRLSTFLFSSLPRIHPAQARGRPALPRSCLKTKPTGIPGRDGKIRDTSCSWKRLARFSPPLLLCVVPLPLSSAQEEQFSFQMQGLAINLAGKSLPSKWEGKEREFCHLPDLHGCRFRAAPDSFKK